MTDPCVLHYEVLGNNGNALASEHFLDNAAGTLANLPENMFSQARESHWYDAKSMGMGKEVSSILNPIECLFSQ